MDLQMAVFSIVGIIFLGFLAMLYRHFTYWPKRGIPYIKTFPIIGVFTSFIFRLKSSADLVQDLYHACPGSKYYGAMNMNVPLLVIKDPEIAKEIGIKSFDYFPNHRSFVEEGFDPLLSRNVFSLKDDRWREMRAILSPSFTANKMKYMFQLVSKCSINFVRYMEKNPDARKELDLQDAFTRYTNDVIATAAFGISVDSMKDRNNEFYLRGIDASNFGTWPRRLKMVGARVFPKLLRRIGLRFMSQKTDEFFKKLVSETVTTREQNGIKRPDMINLLMEAKMSTDDMIAQAFIFFLAGFDTVSRLMCFTCHLLAYHSDVQERLRREVDDVLDQNGDDVGYDMLAKMAYMDMVIQESMRLYPPIPLIDRVCRKAYTLPPAMEGCKAFTVQPNTAIWITMFGFHRDPNYFPEPEKFNPERFTEENKNNIKPYTYLPFGLGPRKCIGERFALMETKIILAHLLRYFVFKPTNKTTREITFSSNSFGTGSEKGFWMTLEARN